MSVVVTPLVVSLVVELLCDSMVLGNSVLLSVDNVVGKAVGETEVLLVDPEDCTVEVVRIFEVEGVLDVGVPCNVDLTGVVASVLVLLVVEAND